jgi:hypothetical protein
VPAAVKVTAPALIEQTEEADESMERVTARLEVATAVGV